MAFACCTDGLSANANANANANVNVNVNGSASGNYTDLDDFDGWPSHGPLDQARGRIDR